MIILIILLIIGLIAAFLLNFYRDPYRKITAGNYIVSPADGKVISIMKLSGKDEIKIRKGLIGKIRTMTSDIGNDCYVVSMFMSPFDFHINRSPIKGTIKSIKYKRGKFFKAYDMEKSLENEKNEITISNNKIKVKVIQIAGFLARKIICDVKENQKVNKGQKIGMIALGSQTTLIMPAGVELKVSLNDKVKAGQTIMAEVNN